MTKVKSPAVEITVRGKVVNQQQIASFTKAFNGQVEAITVWANYCAIHAIAHGNTNPLNNMLDNQAFRLKSGKLSKLGDEVLAYIKLHAPLIQFDKETGKVKLAKVGDTNPAKGKFVDFENLDEEAKSTFCEPGDFFYTFEEFRDFDKPKAKKPAPKLKAETVANQAEKAIENIKAGTFSASIEEAAALAAKLKALYLEVEALQSKLLAPVLVDGEKQVDVEKANELLKSGQAGKSVRAGKVATN